MSQWILKSALDSIPVSFEQLAQLLADGGICETDLVRAEYNENWQYVDSVVGWNYWMAWLVVLVRIEPISKTGTYV